MTKFKTWLSLRLKILKKSPNLHNNPEENQIKISRVFICTDAYTSTFGGGGKEGIILIFTCYKKLFLMKIRKELVTRCRARGCEVNLKVVNTKILCSVKKCKRLVLQIFN